MASTLLITLISNNLSKYNPEVSREWINLYSANVAGFTPNKGQITTNEGREAKEVIFYTSNKNLIAYITEKGISYVIYSGNNFSRVDYELIGAKIEKSKVEYYDELPGYENYYLAHYPEGILFVKSYKKVVIKDIYENIDWVFRYDEFGKLHHEFILKKGGEIADIRIRIKNAEVEIRDKEIEMKTPIGSIIDGKLVAYENTKEVEVNYKLKEDLIGFALSEYNANGNLVIDPQLLWLISCGEEDEYTEDYNPRITIDKNNNVYIVATTRFPSFPTYNPGGNAYFQEKGGEYYSGDVFILKLNGSGERLWATYYGGESEDIANSISIDNNNNVYIVGYTMSENFPIHNPGGDAYFQGSRTGNMDAFIIKFSNNGTRLWATYYGGSGDDVPTSISIDNNNNVYVVGYTRSTDFPVYKAEEVSYFQESKAEDYYDYSDVFILKFDSKGKRLWATYYGGEGQDIATSISIDNNNNVYIVGYTTSENFPLYNPGGSAYFQEINAGVNDIFILKFNSKGDIQWATYYGGNSDDYASSISIDNNNNLYIVGHTWSTNFPVYSQELLAYYQGIKSGEGFNDGFIVKFSSNGERIWATYLGGDNEDYANSVSVDNNNIVYVVGYTKSENLLNLSLEKDAYYQKKIAGDYDAFIFKFNSDGVLLWSTYYGGSAADHTTSISIDKSNNLLVTGHTHSPDFPVNNSVGDTYSKESNSGTNNIFILKFNGNKLRE